jgi:hypothetical protein
MKTKSIALLIVVFTISLFSCKTKFEKKIIGTWAIDNVINKAENNDVYLKSNMITFNEKNICFLPVFEKNQDKKGSWKIDYKEDTVLIINANNNPLNGSYHIKFKRDSENKLLRLFINSETYELECSKLLHNYDKDKDF